ncbi:uncharacterized protein ACB058_001282 [Synchiropus picturatus]
MCKIQSLRAEVKQRLNEAVRDVFELFERTIDELAEELRRSKEENERQRNLLDAILKPRVYLCRTDCELGKEPVNEKQDPLRQQKLSCIQDPTSSILPIVKKEPEEHLVRQVLGAQEEQESADTSLLLRSLKVEQDCSGGDEDLHSSGPCQSDGCQNRELTSGSTLNLKGVERDDSYRGSELASLLHPGKFPHPQPRVTVRVPNSSHSQADRSKRRLGDEENPSVSKPFVCPLCGKAFRCRSTFRYHIRIHSGEKPFCCSVCGHRFRQRSDLVAHFRVHTGYKPFSCTLCPMTFSRSYSLGLHMRTHTGEKPFACTLCLKRFAWKSQLKKHHCVAFVSGVNESAPSEMPLMQQEVFIPSSQFQ